MPELPEVETIRLQLSSVLVGKTIKQVEIRKTKLFKGKPEAIQGRKILGFRRFSKLLVIDLSDEMSLAIHLKMTGRLVIKQNSEIDYEKDKHTHVIIHFTDGNKLFFHDLRQFGYIQVLKTGEITSLSYLRSLGKEFLKDLTLKDFADVLTTSNQSIKVILMDQTKFAGVGNIYANEALWCAKINPKVKANALTTSLVASVFSCLETILRQAIKWKGASDNNYRDAFGQKGEVQEHFQVYNRENQPCFRCKTKIKKINLGGRGTYFCPACQR